MLHVLGQYGGTVPRRRLVLQRSLAALHLGFPSHWRWIEHVSERMLVRWTLCVQMQLLGRALWTGHEAHAPTCGGLLRPVLAHEDGAQARQSFLQSPSTLVQLIQHER